MTPLLAIVPLTGSGLMIYYTYENVKYVNVCLPGIFHCERFNFIVPRRIRLLLAVGAVVVLFLIGLSIIMGALMIALVLSIIGLLIGVYGVYLQVSHRAYCMYCLTTDVILFLTTILIIINS
ncbi:hypothetical protein [Vulcanisaeta souniana]|uniref:Vitamin K epoxide reductase domain-containing protein n=1 Tax=Vulcanisaeta souniana JCM 11219 TaxID=1293586 RepID=A0A830E0E3_9CREN|nr:hypothetical protein [Vulcanisaeta souniana]BDR92313.1 hypothetical protein Vsou_14060 [Vulcanisaeta souniana JCM 11219]GGI74664.1 hypothetical protein GCM10007112_09230 [Vulcanisaeta souniana JCM 11219]